MSSDVNKFYFRLVLLGSNGTGKTSILNRFLFSKFEPKHKPTVEDLFTKSFDLGSIEIKVDILDTSGSMQFPAMRRLSITNGDAFLIVYSVDDKQSFEVLKMCIGEIQETRPNDYQEIPIVFAGNKADLPREARLVSKELVSNYVYYELPRLRTKVIECSCKENSNIEAIFRAYLSLARVSLAATPPIGQNPSRISSTSSLISGGGLAKRFSSTKRRPASAVPLESPTECGGKPAGGSFKLALGVRKSCDASIVSSMRKVSLSSARSSPHDLEPNLEQKSSSSTPDQKASAKLTATDNNSNQSNNNAPLNNYSIRAKDTDDQHNKARTEDEESRYQDEDADDASAELNSKRAPQKSSIESILKAAAIQGNSNQSGAKLRTSHDLKPRSRSLIWRPHRKASRASSNSEQSECRVS